MPSRLGLNIEPGFKANVIITTGIREHLFFYNSQKNPNREENRKTPNRGKINS